MARFSLSFKDINKIVLVITIASLAYKRGHFAGTYIPSPFQMLFVLLLVLTTIYILTNLSVKEFFRSFPRKILIAAGCLYASVLLGWAIGSTFLGIPTTVSTIQDFGTFTISLLIFLLVFFYTKDDQRYARWCVYALLIPNIYPFYFFITHGFVGYWGVLNDGSLSGIVDPNLYSKTLLLPALFFIGASLFAAKNKKWGITIGSAIIASLYSMLILWTASRGSAVSLIAGAALLWAVFSFRKFSWKKSLGTAVLIFMIFSLGYSLLPQGTQRELYIKLTHTGSLPRSADGTLATIVSNPNVTLEELGATPRTDVRIYEWSYFLKYGFFHPLGVGPSASSVNYQKDGDLQLRPGNTYIQVWLWGGVFALAGFVYIIRGAFAALWLRLRRNFEVMPLALLASLLALSIAIIFDASLYFYWYFIVLALALQSNSYES